jgi:hypothetical protein
VRAKTGTLTGVHALAGITVGRDGEPMAFVFGADKAKDEDRYDAQEALDRAAAALAACRCSGCSATGSARARGYPSGDLPAQLPGSDWLSGHVPARAPACTRLDRSFFAPG